MSHVDVGFLEKTDSRLLKSNFFPSKIGGKPSWLSLKQIPTAENLLCQICSKPMTFLCQVYAPFEEKDNCFHRTLFLFVCRNATCCIPNENKNLVVFRSQLARENDFYPSDPPNENSDDFSIEKHIKICSVCGILANKHCSKCKKTSYCTREHQIVDWKSGHKLFCEASSVGVSTIEASDKQNVDNSVLFEEWELITEEEANNKETEESEEEAEKRRMKEYEELVKKGKAGTMEETSEVDLQSYASVDEDKVFSQFRKRIAFNPDQVLRYERGGEPLWVAKEPRPTEVPPCEECGAPRQFEFQILPQLLSELHEYTLDWGTLVVYTCKDSCDGASSSYKKEFLFKQDIQGNSS